MKKLSIILIFALTGCAILYANRSFLYKSEQDWKHMRLEDVKKIMYNGGNINEKNTYGYTPLCMACRYNLHLNMIKFMIENGANPSECNLDEYIMNASTNNNYSLVIKGTSILLKLGVPASTYAEETLLKKFPLKQKETVNFFKEYNTYPSKTFLRDAITMNPMKYKELQNLYNVKATDKEIALWRIKSPTMQEKRNTKDWYNLVEQVKKLGIVDGNIGISKSNYITKYGVPDKEYKVNSETTILVYTQENRINIPISAHTTTSSYGTSRYNEFLDNIQTDSYGHSHTTVRGGYMKVNQQQHNVYIDKGIVTGFKAKDKIVTH